MQEFDFTLILTGISDLTDDQMEALVEAGCDDATVVQRNGRVYVTFTRTAESITDAVLSAVRDVKRADVGSGVRLFRRSLGA